jgi:hypothetical protein
MRYIADNDHTKIVNEHPFSKDEIKEFLLQRGDKFKELTDFVKERISERYRIENCTEYAIRAIRLNLSNGFVLVLKMWTEGYIGDETLGFDLYGEIGNYGRSVTVEMDKIPADDFELFFNLLIGEMRSIGI